MRRGTLTGAFHSPANSRSGSVASSFGICGNATARSGTRSRCPQAGHFPKRPAWSSGAFSPLPHPGQGNRCRLRPLSFATIANTLCVWPQLSCTCGRVFNYLPLSDSFTPGSDSSHAKSPSMCSACSAASSPRPAAFSHRAIAASKHFSGCLKL